MRNSQSTVGLEVLWLVVFLAVFAAVTFAFLTLLVPHHFNDRVAIMIAAIISGVAMITLRAWYARRGPA